MKRTILLSAAGGLLVASAALIATHFLTAPAAGHVSMQIDVKPAIMTSAYKVYANREAGNGRYWLARVVLKNDGQRALGNVETSFQVPGQIGWTTPRRYPELLPGQTVVVLFYPRFPDAVAGKTTNTTEQVEFRVAYDGKGGRQEESRQVDFQMRGRNDMIYTTLPASEIVSAHDLYENTDLLATFVTPDDPVIKYFVQQLEQKVMGGTSVGAGADVEETLRFMHAVYAYWVASGIVYAGTEGLPERSGDSITMVQHVRLPREVLVGQAGLCVELATLFASIAQAAGLQPVILTTEQHAYPAIKVGNSVIPFEATAVGMPGRGQRPASFEQAVAIGQANLEAWMQGRGQSVADGKVVMEPGMPIGWYDIAELHQQGIVPPELPDDPALKQKIDDTLASLLGGKRASAATPAPARTAQADPARRAAESQESGIAGSAYSDPRGHFALTIPTGWQAAAMPYPGMPALALQAMDRGSGSGLEVYVFEGAENAPGAMSVIQQAIGTSGGVVQFAPSGSATLGGKSFQRFDGTTYFPATGTGTEWEAYARAAGNVTIVLTVGTAPGQLAARRAYLRQVARTLRVRA
jgi:hypothetical protein